jgi:hypothetical protein
LGRALAANTKDCEFQRSWGAIGLLAVATSDSEGPPAELSAIIPDAGAARGRIVGPVKAKLDRKEGITVVETLAPERYREAHIPGALNIPPERIKELAPQLLRNKDAEIITYCTNTH